MGTTSKTPPKTLESPAEQRAHVHAILEKMKDVMFVSYQSTGESPALNARPLHVTKLDDDDSLWFMVSLDSTTVEEIERHDRAMVTAQDGSRWIHLAGRVDVVRDRAVVRDLWSKMHEVWFPHGPDDPTVGLLRFRPTDAEYWDSSGVSGIKYLFQMARALATGTSAKPVKGSHGEVGLKH